MDIIDILSNFNNFVDTPLNVLLSLSLVFFIFYYFLKIAPERYKRMINLIEKTSKQNSNYEKALENSNKVIENNTVTLKTIQSIIELFTHKVELEIEQNDEILEEVKNNRESIMKTTNILSRVEGKIDR